ncbi:MAG TPA: DUF1707 domain-containing protein [Gemmatimonadaceae bacterium]|nr:DUF1707 domain-containing protein [Gemmatimonadaceae bacterium]
MTPPQPPSSIQALEQERERVITLLSRHFASDHLSIEDLETRLEMAYRASSVAEIRALASDLPTAEGATGTPALRPAPTPSQRVRTRLVSVLGTRARRGLWVPPQQLDLVAVMSETHLDLRHAQLSAGVTEIRIKATFASVRVTVPPHVHVVVETTPVLAAVNDRSDQRRLPPHGAPVVRITGWAVMSEVTVRTRSVED